VAPVAGDEELGSERVAEGEPEEGQPGTLKAVMKHLLLIFTEVLSVRLLVRRPSMGALRQKRPVDVKPTSV
jgi:hypothetical protein